MGRAGRVVLLNSVGGNQILAGESKEALGQNLANGETAAVFCVAHHGHMWWLVLGTQGSGAAHDDADARHGREEPDAGDSWSRLLKESSFVLGQGKHGVRCGLSHTSLVTLRLSTGDPQGPQQPAMRSARWPSPALSRQLHERSRHSLLYRSANRFDNEKFCFVMACRIVLSNGRWAVSQVRLRCRCAEGSRVLRNGEARRVPSPGAGLRCGWLVQRQ
jgi:hypothetical protein